MARNDIVLVDSLITKARAQIGLEKDAEDYLRATAQVLDYVGFGDKSG